MGSFTSDALIGYLEQLEARCSPSTVKKERAALRKLARYLHQLGLVDATVILMVEIPTVTTCANAPRPRSPHLGKGADHRTRATRRLRANTLLTAHRGA